MHPSIAPSEQTAVAASAEYRHFGDDSALLIVVVQAHGSALPGDARLMVPEGEPVVASALTFQPDAGLARLVFAVDRRVASNARSGLYVTLGAGQPVAVPEPINRPAIGVPDGELEHAVAAGVAGDELAGLLRVLERRAAIAERVAGDLREEPSEATKLAQSYREIWEVRDLLESREDAYKRSAEAVDAAELAQRAAEEAAEQARAELEDVRAESQAATERIEAELAERASEIVTARARHEVLETEREDAFGVAAQLSVDLEEATETANRLEQELAERDEALQRLADEQTAARTRHEELETERDDARAGVERLEEYLEERAATVERVEGELADANARAEELEKERDDALGAAGQAEVDAEEQIAEIERLERECAERADDLEELKATSAEKTERFDAELAAASQRFDTELAAANARAAELEAELDEARTRATDAEALLDAERTLHEARLAEASTGSERQLSDLFAEAQRERLRQTPADEQQAQVAALERQLARMRQNGSGVNG